MKHFDEYRNRELSQNLLRELLENITKPVRVMEVCGSHTMAIFRDGLRSVLPEKMKLISGPGCPVCVTSASHMDAFISFTKVDRVRVATFGDLFRVPGTNSSLAQASSTGAKIDIVYSPMDALQLAQENPDELIVFLGVGFETTTPGIGATILAAKNQNIKNFFVFSTQKTMNAPMRALLSDPELQIDGLLCPGHVSSILGAKYWETFAKEFSISCAVSGFETADLIKSLTVLARQVANKDFTVKNLYPRAVSSAGNSRAQEMVAEIFKPCDMVWRGLGNIPESGLTIRNKYEQFDAEKRFDLELPEVKEPPGCLCGEILKGKKTPIECGLFDKHCNPSTPVGPCMVSSEGTCAAYYRYGREL